MLKLESDGTRPVPVLVDCLSTWRRTRRHVVAVSSEVGCGVVSATASGRRYRDELGNLNVRGADGADEVWDCLAGVAQRLK